MVKWPEDKYVLRNGRNQPMHSKEDEEQQKIFEYNKGIVAKDHGKKLAAIS
jgi:predicted peptidase